jgi:alpha-glucosidase (family GH31 glycosyl hydrolase)
MYKSYKYGDAVVRPLFFEYPTDDQAFINIESSFFLGDSIYVTPSLSTDPTYTAYFPIGNWVNVIDLTTITNTVGANVTLNYKEALPNAFLR